MYICRTVFTILLTVLSAHAAHQYQFEITAEPDRDLIAGKLTLTYQNDTGVLLEEIPIRGTAAIKRVSAPEGTPLVLKGSRVRLNAPLEKDQKVTIVFEFESRLPIGPMGYRLLSGAWHPKAETFRKGGFNPLQEQPDNYDLLMTIPSGHMVAVAGTRLQDEVSLEGQRTLRVVLENATSLGIAVSDKFMETRRTSAGVEIRSFELGDSMKWSPRLAELAADIVPFYRKLADFFPFQSLVILPGSNDAQGGYPVASGMVAIHSLENTTPEFQTWIVAHEIAHQYWGMDTVIDDGDYSHWPGLGLGLWMDRQYMESKELGRRIHDSFIFDTYMPAVYDGLDTRLNRTLSESSRLDFDFNNIVAHGKAYAVIQMLEELLGPDKFRRIALNLLKSHKFRFLSHLDFEKKITDAYGKEIGPFFHDWLEGNYKLSYEIVEVKHEDRTGTIRVRQTGDALLPLPLEVRTSDGEVQRLRLKWELGEQVLTFESKTPPVSVAIDPERRFALFSPDAKHVWRKGVEVTGVRWPEVMAWGSNRAVVVLRNTDGQPREITLNIQTNSAQGGLGWDTTHWLEAGEEKAIERDFILRPYPGPFTVRLRVRDLEDGLFVKWASTKGQFPAGNDRLNPMRLTGNVGNLLKAQRREYPSLRLLKGENTYLYYMGDDPWLEQNSADLLAEHDRLYQEVRSRIDPGFGKKISIILFPDSDSKRVWTGDGRAGSVIGDMVLQIRDAATKTNARHEFIHTIGDAAGKPPALLRDGLAVYLQEGQVWEGFHIDAWCKAFSAAGMLWPILRLGSLADIGASDTQPGITYPQSGSIVKFLVDRVGWEKFLAGYRALGDPQIRSMEEAVKVLQTHFSMDPFSLEREWKASVDASNREPVPADVLKRIREELK